MFKNKKSDTTKEKLEWLWEFTKVMISLISLAWLFSTLFSASMVFYAIHKTGEFSFLDTFIIENNATFRDIVGINLIKSGVENVFKYNNYGGERQKYEKKSRRSNNENKEEDSVG